MTDTTKIMYNTPYPEPMYTGWPSVHWNATGMPLADPVYSGIPLGDPANTCRVHWNTTGKLSWNCPTLEYHWRNLVETAPHWDATGETLTVGEVILQLSIEAMASHSNSTKPLPQLRTEYILLRTSSSTTHWKTTGATSTLGCHWNHTGWCSHPVVFQWRFSVNLHNWNTLKDHWSHKYTWMPLEPHWLMIAPTGVPVAIQCQFA